MDAFRLDTTVTFTTVSGAAAPTTTVQHQVWSLPATTFPVITPFTIDSADGGSQVGAGELSTHIAGKCPPAGQPSMQVAWVQTA